MEWTYLFSRGSLYIQYFPDLKAIIKALKLVFHACLNIIQIFVGI